MPERGAASTTPLPRVDCPRFNQRLSLARNPECELTEVERVCNSYRLRGPEERAAGSSLAFTAMEAERCLPPERRSDVTQLIGHL